MITITKQGGHTKQVEIDMQVKSVEIEDDHYIIVKVLLIRGYDNVTCPHLYAGSLHT